MPNLKFTILKTIYNQPHQEAHRKTLYKLKKKKPQMIKSTIDDLLELELIERVVCSDKYRLTKPGMVEFRLIQRERKHNIHKWINTFVSVLATVISLISLIAPNNK